ncbi:MAG: TPM domain-containing protein [Candidatus Paceibacterota bacterium]
MRWLLVACLSALVFTSTAFAFDAPSKPTGYVNDYAGILSVETKQGLEKELTLFTASTTNEIAVVTVPDLGGITIEEYAIKIFDAWKIGKEKQDNGVLFLIAPNDRTARIEVGYGLEGALPDILAKDILNTKVFPEFKNGNYNLGILQGVKAIAEATKGEYSPVGTNKNSSGNSNLSGIAIFIIIIFQFFSALFARSKSWWAGAIAGGLLSGGIVYFFGYIFGVTFIVGVGVVVVSIFLGALFDYIVSSGYQKAKLQGSSVPWWAGGGSGSSSSSSGGSFGGFGGGSSGGGGASGSW